MKVGYYFQMWKEHFLLEWDLCSIWQFGHDIHCDFYFPSFIPQAPNCYALWNTLNSWPCALLTYANNMSTPFLSSFLLSSPDNISPLYMNYRLSKSWRNLTKRGHGLWFRNHPPPSSSSCCTCTYCLIIFNKKTQNISQFRTEPCMLLPLV